MPKKALSSPQRSCLLFVFLFSILYAHFLSWGLPLWDDDFGWWLNPIADKSIWDLILEILSPLSAQSENWAFNERPVQRLIYKISYLVSEREKLVLFFYQIAFLCRDGLFFLPLVRETARCPRSQLSFDYHDTVFSIYSRSGRKFCAATRFSRQWQNFLFWRVAISFGVLLSQKLNLSRSLQKQDLSSSSTHRSTHLRSCSLFFYLLRHKE